MKRGWKIGFASVAMLGIALAISAYYIFSPYHRVSISHISLTELGEHYRNDAELTEPLPPYGMRARFDPSFGAYRYIITFKPLPKGCVVPSIEPSVIPETIENWCRKAAVKAVRKSIDGAAPPEIREFEVPATEYYDAFGRLRYLWDNESLHELMGTDGTDVGIEIRTDRGLMSFGTNDRSSPKSPTARINNDILRMMLAYGPDKFFPCGLDWRVARDMDGLKDNSVKGSPSCLLTKHQEQEQPAP